MTGHQRFIDKVIAEEMAIVPGPCKVKGDYLCYILRSVVAPRRTYSGSSNDFCHRIRQHNGVITGGAVATKTSRPWRIAALVYGFSTRSAALRYEFFTKIKRAKISLKGKDSLQRRATMMAYAELKMCPSERPGLTYFLPDYFFRRSVEEARAAGIPGTLEEAFKRAAAEIADDGAELAEAAADAAHP